MASLTSPGIGSGLDINGLVTKLMDVERAPLTALAKKEADFQAKLTAYGTLKGSLSAFQTAAKSLAVPGKFTTFKASAADASILSASTTSIAKPGSYSVEVGQLAKAHKLAMATSVDDTTTAIGTGTLTIDFGTDDAGSFEPNTEKTSTEITIDNSNNSLAGIRDAINQAKAGVSASIINDGSGYRLVLSSTESGKANSLRVLVDDADTTDTDGNGLSRLAYDPEGVKNLEEKVVAQDAELTIDGIEISKSSNTINDAIAGVTFTLLKETAADQPTTLTVSHDAAAAKTALEGFVKSYNDLATTMKNLGGYDAKTKKGGLLLGDSTLRSLDSQLRNLMTQRVRHVDGAAASLSDAGIAFQRDGTLAIDSAKLGSLLADAPGDIASLFATLGRPSDSLVTYSGSSSSTKPGSYDLEITQLATRGTATGSQQLGVATVVDSGDTLAVKIDGTTATIALTADTYSRDDLAAEIQSSINSNSTFKALGYKVTVGLTASNELVVTSTRYGTSSKVEITGGTAKEDLFDSVTSVPGVDVAGKIGSVAATGKGQTLTGAGDASGLKLLVEGGSTGSRGTVAFSNGIAAQIDSLVTGLLASDGIIAARTAGVDESIKDIGERRERLGDRLLQVEKRYRAQFNALDRLVASMQQTSTYLAQQLANLPSANKS